MANLFQATVYQIDGSPLPQPITLDFPTTDIIVREEAINIAAVNSAIYVYNLPLSPLSYKTYHVSETVSTLVGLANTTVSSLVQVTVLEIGGDPLPPNGLQYAFPVGEIVVGENVNPTTGVNATITYKSETYSTSQTQATILASSSGFAGLVQNQLAVPSFRADTFANLPLPGQPGRMFISTDTYAFYRDTGAAWDLIGGPGTGTVTGSGTATQVAFWNGSSILTGSNNLFWDSSNNRLGVNTAAPAFTLDVRGRSYIEGAPTAYVFSESVLTVKNTNVAGPGQNTYGLVTLDTAGIGVADIRLGSNATGLRLYATDVPAIISTGGAIQMFRTSDPGLSGQVYIDSGSSSASSIIFRTAPAATTLSERMRVFSNGNVGINVNGVDAGYRLDVNGTFRSTGDANINGLTVGKGLGSIATNTAVGIEALFSNTTATNNVSLGYRTLRSATTGGFNIGIGGNSVGDGTSTLFALTTGAYNIGIGAGALRSVTTVNGNIGIGYLAGEVTTGQYNTYTGYAGGYQVTTGEYNTIVGGLSGWGITTGSNNTIIGARVQGLSSSLSNTIILADGQGNQRLYINNTGLTGLGITSPANALHIDRGNATASYLQFTAGTTTGQLATDGFEVGIDASGNGVINQQENLPMLFYTNNTERMRVTAAGRLLIGTTTESTFLLDVNGTARVQNNSGLSLQIGTTTSTSTATPAVLSLGGTFGSGAAGSSSNLKLRIWDDGNPTIYYGLGISSGMLEIQCPENIGFYTGNSASRTERVRITQGGTLAIGTSSPNASALLDVSSTTKGFLPPRMTGAQAEAIATPAEGLMVYATSGNGVTITSKGWWGFEGATWVKLN